VGAAQCAREELADVAEPVVRLRGVCVYLLRHVGAGREAPLPLYLRNRARSRPLSCGEGKIVRGAGGGRLRSV